MHLCEPSLPELELRWKELLCAESTNENMKKLRAIEAQIERRKKECPTINHNA